MQFFKYHGTGNDFVLIDNRSGKYNLSKKAIAAICHRRFGVGADGLMLLQNKEAYDFEMVYYNADGGETSMCGNGGRCIVRFAYDLGIVKQEAYFIAIDGPHKAKVYPDKIALEMIDVNEFTQLDNACVLDTGSPHYVTYQSDLVNAKVDVLGSEIRNSEQYKADGINVNFIEKEADGTLFVRTFERGVEDETYSCGTGVVASSLSDFLKDTSTPNMRKVKTLGGALEVHFDYVNGGFENIVLSGPAQFVFKGEI